jgi:hypothetical protein
MVSEGLDRELSLAERTHLKIHLSICHSCTNFHGQMNLLRKAMQGLNHSDDIHHKQDTK